MSSGVIFFYPYYSARTDASSVVQYLLASVVLCYTLFGLLSWCNDGSTRISKNGPYLSPTTGTEKILMKSHENNQQIGPEAALNCSRFINTRKFKVDCMGTPTKLYKILITGLGGSGTHLVAEAAERVGLRLPHEKLGYDGSVVRCRSLWNLRHFLRLWSFHFLIRNAWMPANCILHLL